MTELILASVTGTILSIRPVSESCCEQQLTLKTENGMTQLRLKPSTLVAGNLRLMPGMTVTAFYDANAPAILIYPPRYDAVIIARKSAREHVFAGYFDSSLVAADQSLKINPGPSTVMVTANGQRFTCDPGNHLLIVFYRTTTRSIPPQTTPHKIIVVCAGA